MVTSSQVQLRLALRSALGAEAGRARCLMDGVTPGEKFEGKGPHLGLLAQNRPGSHQSIRSCSPCQRWLGRVNPALEGLTWCQACKIEIILKPCAKPPMI
jgi:hypothetical protein